MEIEELVKWYFYFGLLNVEVLVFFVLIYYIVISVLILKYILWCLNMRRRKDYSDLLDVVIFIV